MPATLPRGHRAPDDGALPASALAGLGTRAFGIYVHIPFCATRCGYCDFNTYTADELSADAAATYADQVRTEIRLARRVLGPGAPTVGTVFFGGGTPTMMPPHVLTAILGEIERSFGLRPDAEVTVEANPDSVSRLALERLRSGGINRLSFGMQSSVPHVLKTLDRSHDPARVQQAVAWSRAAGFDNVSLDLIYGTPGESVGEWAASVEAALDCEPDHVSAYSLIVEDGTALARKVRRREIAAPDEDDLADKYLLADEMLSAAGLRWYELSNWAAENRRCRHNELYWTGADWWGAGAGAHSHVGGTRWWNRKHPTAYVDRLAAGLSPAQAREVLDGETRRTERVLLEIRRREGLPLDVLDDTGLDHLSGIVGRGLGETVAGRLVLTPTGRLLADAVVRELL